VRLGLGMVLRGFFFSVEIVARLALAGLDGNLPDDTTSSASTGCAVQQGLGIVLRGFFFFVEIVAPLALAGFDGNLPDDGTRSASTSCVLEDGLEKVLTPFFVLLEIVVRLELVGFISSLDGFRIGRPNSGNSQAKESASCGYAMRKSNRCW
jgi:hypothetical protein